MFWTDSTSVLKYLKNEDKSFLTFVANSMAMIRESFNVAQWRYIPTTQNPADDASRGLKIEHLVQGKRIESPKFLWETESERSRHPVDTEIVDDPEIKKIIAVNSVVTEDTVNPTEQLICHFSSWKRLRVAVDWILKLEKILICLS